jgi:zinc protease
LKDKEASSAQVQLLYKDYAAPKKMVNLGDFKNYMIENLFATLLNTRLDELTNSSTPPSLMGIPIMEELCKNQKGYQSVAMSQEDKQLSALKVLVTENERARNLIYTRRIRSC